MIKESKKQFAIAEQILLQNPPTPLSSVARFFQRDAFNTVLTPVRDDRRRRLLSNDVSRRLLSNEVSGVVSAGIADSTSDGVCEGALAIVMLPAHEAVAADAFAPLMGMLASAERFAPPRVLRRTDAFSLTAVAATRTVFTAFSRVRLESIAGCPAGMPQHDRWPATRGSQGGCRLYFSGCRRSTQVFASFGSRAFCFDLAKRSYKSPRDCASWR